MIPNQRSNERKCNTSSCTCSNYFPPHSVVTKCADKGLSETCCLACVCGQENKGSLVDPYKPMLPGATVLPSYQLCYLVQDTTLQGQQAEKLHNNGQSDIKLGSPNILDNVVVAIFIEDARIEPTLQNVQDAIEDQFQVSIHIEGSAYNGPHILITPLCPMYVCHVYMCPS